MTNTHTCPNCHGPLQPHEYTTGHHTWDCTPIEKTAETETPALPPDPEEMNEQRAEAAHATVEYFAERFGERGDDLLEQNIVDLLGDLAHLCDRQDLNLASLWEEAATHYNAETDNEGTQMDTIPTN